MLEQPNSRLVSHIPLQKGSLLSGKREKGQGRERLPAEYKLPVLKAFNWDDSATNNTKSDVGTYAVGVKEPTR